MDENKYFWYTRTYITTFASIIGVDIMEKLKKDCFRSLKAPLVMEIQK
ncbi:hypothetical protein JTF06_09950 [Desemzia sp. RIT804]|nr:hypothetical protein [Desemzia sp. RIT 804]MBM6615209.1 hypothetical protein [Desemzia sp. RIT 804]